MDFVSAKEHQFNFNEIREEEEPWIIDWGGRTSGVRKKETKAGGKAPQKVERESSAVQRCWAVMPRPASVQLQCNSSQMSGTKGLQTLSLRQLYREGGHKVTVARGRRKIKALFLYRESQVGPAHSTPKLCPRLWKGLSEMEKLRTFVCW